MQRALKGYAPRLALAGVSVFVAFVSLEGSLRILGLVPPSAFYRLDPLTGHSHRPGARGWFRQEGQAYIEINEQGLRGPTVADAKPRDALRIALLGDSFVEALQVPFERTFGSVLERKLVSSCVPNAEVIGFGVSDYGTAQELLTLRERVWEYEPDIVVVAVFTGNDIRNNSIKLDPIQNRPYFTLDAGELVPSDRFLEWQKPRRHYFAIISQSSVLLWLDYLRSRLTTAWQSADPVGGKAGMDEPIYTKPSSGPWEDAWAITELLLLAMEHNTQEHGAELLVVTLSNGIQVHPDSSIRLALAERLGVEDLFYADRRLADFGGLNGISILNLAPAFQRYAEEHSIYLHGFENGQLGFGHWNENGHSLAGELVAQRLCDDLSSDSH